MSVITSNRTKALPGNPLLADPTRTTVLRQKFERDLRKRFYALKGMILRLVVDEDAFGLKVSRPQTPFSTNELLGNQRWRFHSDPEKVKAFEKWLKENIDTSILGGSSTDPSDAYWEAYVQEGYRKGAGRAFDDVKKPLLKEGNSQSFVMGAREQFLREAFGQPETIEKVKLLAGRVFTDLKGINEVMSTQISRVLTDGLVQGMNPNDIARRINDRVDKIGRTRATVMARTEIIRAHAEGQLDAFEKLGVIELGVQVEWSTAGDTRVCELCAPLEGIVIKVSEARSLIPRHAQCRCAWIPANVGESDSYQSKGPVQIQEKRNESVKREIPKGSNITLKEQKKLSPWAGALRKFSSKRPKSILADASPAELKKQAAQQQARIEAKKVAIQKQKAIDAEIAAKKAAEEKAAKEAEEAAAKKAQAEKLAKEAAEKAAKEAAEKAAKEAAEKAAKEAAEKEAKRIAEEQKKLIAEKLAAEKAGKFPELSDLEFVKNLPGSTRPDLMRNKYTGKNWVMKSSGKGIDPEHLRSEALADNLYRELDIPVPKSTILESAEGPAKISEFLSGETLEDWKTWHDANDLRKVYAETRQGFVADALLANHDVAGLSFDNLFISGPNRVYRIDNGGALTFRAQGARKANFGAVVEELETMRNASINPNTAEIFGSLTDDEIHEQIRAILPKRKRVLSLVEDSDLRETLSKRFDYLEGLLPKPEEVVKARSTGKTSLARAKKRVAEPGITKDTAKRVERSRINGTTISGDEGDIEDLNILVWEELDDLGKPVTRMQLKVTPEGSKKVMNSLGPLDDIPSPVSSDPDILPEDTFHDAFVKAAKTIAVHADDGQYNMATLKVFEDQLALAGKFAETSTNPVFKKMGKYYEDLGDEILGAKSLGNAPPQVKPYKPPKPKAKPKPKSASPFKVQQEDMRFRTAKIERGRVRRVDDEFNEVGYFGDRAKQYRIDAGDGTEIVFNPNSGSTTHTTDLAFQGNMELSVPGKVTTKTLKEAEAKLKTLGLDISAASAETEELLYLHRSIYLRRDHLNSDYMELWNNTSLSTKEKIKGIKKFAEKEYGVDFKALEKAGQYNPQGVTKTSFGDGYRHWERWDLPPAKIEEEMKDFVLTHNSGAPVDELVDKLLDSGGEFTATTGRMRKGVSVRGTGGMSPHADIESGGANYFFTRITKKSEAHKRGQFQFKIRNLSRQDVLSFEGDRYGDINRLAERKHNIEDYKSIARNSSNETDFKHGLSFIDEIETITTRDELQRDRVIEAFKKHKIEKLPDGRKVEDIVIVKSAF